MSTMLDHWQPLATIGNTTDNHWQPLAAIGSHWQPLAKRLPTHDLLPLRDVGT
jgi:hypothetical protein